MTVTGDPATPPASSDAVSERAERAITPGSLAATCPYLVAGDGTWQSALPVREQRCGAVDPAVLLARDKQRDLCLVAAHTGCTTYLAAEASAPLVAVRPRSHADDAELWPTTRSKLLVIEAERRLPGLSGSPVRAGGQIALVALMVVAFVVLLVARTSPSGSGTGADASFAAGASASIAVPAPTASLTPQPSAAATASASPAPTATPKPSPKPTAKPGARHYTIKSGDTLGSIALRFGTTIKVLKRLNGITDPRLIHPGQVLVLP
jgi:LysM repeat protein